MNAGLKFHPLADIFPLMEGAEFDELVADIKAHGLREPITIFEDKILDGRNRDRACREAGVQVVTRDFEGDDPAAFVISANIHRRHLSAKQKSELIAKLLKANPEKSDRQIGNLIGADHKTVGAVRHEKEVTGEIPQLEETVGADGKARKRKGRRGARRRRTKATPPPESKEVRNRRWLMFCAENAIDHAESRDWLQVNLDRELVETVEKAAATWAKRAAYLKDLHGRQQGELETDGKPDNVEPPVGNDCGPTPDFPRRAPALTP